MRRRFASEQPMRIAQPNGARTKGFSDSEFPEDLLPLRRGERASAPTPLGRRDPAGGFEYLTTRCMMRFVRTRVLQSKVRPLLRTKAICALTSKPGTSGTRRWLPFGRLSLTALRRISVGWCPWSLRSEAYRTSDSSFRSLKLPPLLEPPDAGHCAAVRRPPLKPRGYEAARRVFWPPPPLPAFWHSCHHVVRSSLRGV
jgi:hypothetical protein